MVVASKSLIALNSQRTMAAAGGALILLVASCSTVSAFSPLQRSQSVHSHSKQALFMVSPPDLSNTTVQAKFGDVVSLRPPEDTASNEDNAFQFGDVVIRPTATATSTSTDTSYTGITGVDSASPVSAIEQAAAIQRRNLVTGVVAIAVACLNYAWQLSHPITPLQLLMTMQGQSDSITIVGSNAKPTVVDFWAPWCENCKLIAPTLLQVEEEYKDRVNFVLIDGDKQEAWPYIEAFGVDAIPHLALVNANGDVETALIGPIPKHVLEADLDVLIRNGKTESGSSSSLVDLPYKMLDVFANKPEQRRLHFEK